MPTPAIRPSGSPPPAAQYGNLAPSIFCFQNQLDSPLEEELALLRGRDDSGMTVRANPYYNRLIWNFTLGEGEVAYKLTYNISDQNGDGFIDEKDARHTLPAGPRRCLGPLPDRHQELLRAAAPPLLHLGAPRPKR